MNTYQYQDNGYTSREEYLKHLSEDYSVDLEDLIYLANLLGLDEDFDGLLAALEDITRTFND
jgi:hypothetical protein